MHTAAKAAVWGNVRLNYKVFLEAVRPYTHEKQHRDREKHIQAQGHYDRALAGARRQIRINNVFGCIVIGALIDWNRL